MASLDDGALPHRDALPDHERGRGLVRGVKANRAHEVVRLLEPPDHNVALANRGRVGAIVVERQRTRGLPSNLVDELGWSIGPTDDDAVLPLVEIHYSR